VLQKRTQPYRQIQWILSVLRSWSAKEILSMLGIDIEEQMRKAGVQVPSDVDRLKFEWCDFVVWTPQETHVERIYFDAEWWNVQKVQLDRVYLNGFLPEFACPRRPSKPVRGYVLSSGREMIIDSKKGWVKEWSVNDANELQDSS
jgi:hypothetical protein